MTRRPQHRAEKSDVQTWRDVLLRSPFTKELADSLLQLVPSSASAFQKPNQNLGLLRQAVFALEVPDGLAETLSLTDLFSQACFSAPFPSQVFLPVNPSIFPTRTQHLLPRRPNL